MNTTKRIIQRQLPLNEKYILLSTNYISLIDGIGCTCDNCNKLIANIATVKSEITNKTYNVGFDCLETFLINNQLLDGKGVEHYETVVKKSLSKIKKIRIDIKEFISKNPFIDTVEIIHEHWVQDWITFHYFSKGKMVWNDNTKFKVMDFDMLVNSLSTIKNLTVKFIKNEK